MKSFTYVIQDNLGLHARPAGALVKKAGDFKSSVFIDDGSKKADAKRIMAVMGMAVQKDQKVTVTAEGEDEEQAIEALEDFFKNHL